MPSSRETRFRSTRRSRRSDAFGGALAGLGWRVPGSSRGQHEDSILQRRRRSRPRGARAGGGVVTRARYPPATRRHRLCAGVRRLSPERARRSHSLAALVGRPGYGLSCGARLRPRTRIRAGALGRLRGAPRRLRRRAVSGLLPGARRCRRGCSRARRSVRRPSAQRRASRLPIVFSVPGRTHHVSASGPTISTVIVVLVSMTSAGCRCPAAGCCSSPDSTTRGCQMSTWTRGAVSSSHCST